MAARKKINLLPKELSVSKKVMKIAEKVKMLAYMSLSIFIIIMILGGGSLFYFTRQLNSLNQDQERLKNNILSLEETERQLIITKDRIAKIDLILDSRKNEELFAKQKSVVDSLSESMQVKSSEVDLSDSVISFLALESRELSNFMSSLVSRGDTLEIVLDSLSYNPFEGYLVELEIY